MKLELLNNPRNISLSEMIEQAQNAKPKLELRFNTTQQPINAVGAIVGGAIAAGKAFLSQEAAKAISGAANSLLDSVTGNDEEKKSEVNVADARDSMQRYEADAEYFNSIIDLTDGKTNKLFYPYLVMNKGKFAVLTDDERQMEFPNDAKHGVIKRPNISLYPNLINAFKQQERLGVWPFEKDVWVYGGLEIKDHPSTRLYNGISINGLNDPYLHRQKKLAYNSQTLTPYVYSSVIVPQNIINSYHYLNSFIQAGGSVLGAMSIIDPLNKDYYFNELPARMSFTNEQKAQAEKEFNSITLDNILDVIGENGAPVMTAGGGNTYYTSVSENENGTINTTTAASKTRSLTTLGVATALLLK